MPSLFLLSILMDFDKPSQSTEDHIQLLKERGLIITDEDRAEYYLKNIGYYRLSGYMYPFQADNNHRFKDGASFRQVLNHYIFDKKLRFLLLDALERIEISLRTNLTNHYSLSNEPHWFMNQSLFNNSVLHSKFIADLNEKCKDSNERFIKAYYHKYSKPELPPSWMAFETLTFGSLVSVYENLKDDDNKKAIAKVFGTFPSMLESWLKSMLFIRNCSAHHSRLWNRRIPLKPKIPTRKKNRFLENVDDHTNKQLYGILSCIVYVLNHINPTSSFKTKLNALFAEYPDVDTRNMGFPESWKTETLWSASSE
ncbi:MAG: Abi family protein [Leptolyngbya sp. SIO3F4]|nr:Abi family protein [Leptolyngbya sp. SIO3F4]